MITRPWGEYTFRPHAVYSSISHAANDNVHAPPNGWDYIVVTTKALPDITDDAADIEPLVRRGIDHNNNDDKKKNKSCIVLIQNGVGIEETHRRRFPFNPIVSAVTIISAEQIRHGVVRQNRWTRISLGGYSSGTSVSSESDLGSIEQLRRRSDACAREFADILTQYGGIRDAEYHDEIELQLIRWHKICINGAFNPSAVLAGGIGNADIVLDPDLRNHIRGCMEEVFAAVKAVLGREFPSDLATPDAIIRSNGRNRGAKPSMLLDWEARKPMELEVILGNPVRIAKAHGVEMPRLQTLYALLKSAQKARIEKSKETQKEKSNL